MQEAVGELSHAQIADAKKFKAFEEDTRETMRMLSRAKLDARSRYEQIAKSKTRLRQDITHFKGGFESFIGGHSAK